MPIESRSHPPPGELQFEALYHAYFTFVWRCLRALGVPDGQVDDAAQEVFVVVHRRLPEFRQDASVRTWIYGIVRGVAANQRRTLRRKGTEPLSEAARLLTEVGPEDALQQRQRAHFVSRFVEKLNADKRDVFVLALIEQLPVPEIAETLGIPLNTAYTRLRTVRQEFRRAVDKQRGSL